MLKKRILTALGGIPLVVVINYVGGTTFAVVVALLSILGLGEFFRLIRHSEIEPQVFLGYVGGLFIVVSAFPGVHISDSVVITAITLGFFLSALCIPRWSLTGSATSLMGVLYLGLFRYLIYLREMPGGFEVVLALFIFNWVADSGAYFSGKAFGRHLMAPRLSPKKTIEGAIGGVLASVAAALVMTLLGLHVPQLVVMALLVAVTGQAGDLVESAFKRSAGVKDAGGILPGHGGVLDRFDSLLISLPVVYYYFQLFIIN
ncbi:MAG: phosphatidate cytidylyltransferase [Bacillota bacterium]